MISYSWSKNRHSCYNYNEIHPYPILYPEPSAPLGSIFAPNIDASTTPASRRVAVLAKRGRAAKPKIEQAIGQPTCIPSPVFIDPFFKESSLLFEEDDLEADLVDVVFACQREYIDSKNKIEAHKMIRAKRRLNLWSIEENFPLPEEMRRRMAIVRRRATMQQKLDEMKEEEREEELEKMLEMEKSEDAVRCLQNQRCA